MPILFPFIPEHIRISIVEKLDLKDFRRFHECSRISITMAKKLRRTFMHPTHDLIVEETNEGLLIVSLLTRKNEHYIPVTFLDDIPVRISFESFLIRSKLTSKVCQWLLNLILTTHLSCGSLFVDEITCSLNEFNDFLTVSNVWECVLDEETSFEYFIVPAMRKVNKLSINKFLSDLNLLSLKAPFQFLFRTNITSFGVNLLIKEWIHGERIVSQMLIKTNNQIDKNIALNEISHSLWILNSGEQIYVIGENDGNILLLKFAGKCVEISVEHVFMSQYFNFIE